MATHKHHKSRKKKKTKIYVFSPSQQPKERYQAIGNYATHIIMEMSCFWSKGPRAVGGHWSPFRLEGDQSPHISLLKQLAGLWDTCSSAVHESRGWYCIFRQIHSQSLRLSNIKTSFKSKENRKLLYYYHLGEPTCFMVGLNTGESKRTGWFPGIFCYLLLLVQIRPIANSRTSPTI